VFRFAQPREPFPVTLRSQIRDCRTRASHKPSTCQQKEKMPNASHLIHPRCCRPAACKAVNLAILQRRRSSFLVHTSNAICLSLPGYHISSRDLRCLSTRRWTRSTDHLDRCHTKGRPASAPKADLLITPRLIYVDKDDMNKTSTSYARSGPEGLRAFVVPKCRRLEAMA